MINVKCSIRLYLLVAYLECQKIQGKLAVFVR